VNAVLERWFDLRTQGTSVRTEVLAGCTTFLALAYIVFVQPAVLGAAGMDFGAVMAATCLASAFATLLMAWLANYPIAVAPAMGHNFYFAFAVVVGMKVPWPVALGAVAIAGTIFILTAGIGLRERVVSALPPFLQRATAAGIGLLIATIGLQWAGIIVATPGTMVGLGDLGEPATLLALAGLTVTAVLAARGTPVAILAGIGATAALGVTMGLVRFEGVVSAPPSIAPTLLKLDVMGALRPELAPVILIFFILALFDSIGTLVGVASRAGLMRDGQLPLARQALLADAVGTVAGAALGTSTVTAYVESATGVAAGGRTGLANVVTAALLVASLFFAPLVRMIGGGVTVREGVVLYPVVAPALILVGALMMREARHVAWDDLTEALPAFLCMIVMPLTFSITEGLAFGFVAAAVTHLATGRARALHPLAYAIAALFLARFIWLRG
jgi:AGZA family xanthine/uracil permease-like MFS transporter